MPGSSTKASGPETAKRIILAIVHEAGGRFRGKTRLYKAFYAAHLWYWKQSAGILSDYPIARMPKGPGIHRGDDLLRQLVADGSLEIQLDRSGLYPEYVYRTVGPGPEVTQEERHAIGKAVQWVAGRDATQAVQEIHEFSRTWNEAKDGEILDVYRDLLTDEQEEETRAAVGKARELIDNAWG